MLRIALRLHRGGILGYTAFFCAYAFIEVVSYAALTSDKGTFAAQLELIGRQTSYLADPPLRVDLLAGYLQWFLIGFFALFYSVWALLAGTGAIRSDEEKGLLEQWFAAGVTPARLVFSRLVAFYVAVLCSGALVALFALALAWLTGQDLPVGGLFLQLLVQLGPALTVFAFGMLLAQLFPTRRNALGAGGLIVGALVLLNGFSRSVDSLRPFRWISPFAYPDRTHAMTPAGGIDLTAAAIPYVAAVALAGLAAYLQRRRDIGAALVRTGVHAASAVHTPAGNPLLLIPAVNVLWEQRLGLAAWSAGIIVYAVANVPLAKPFVDFFKSGSSLTALQANVAFGMGGKDPVVGFISREWFEVAVILVCAYAITQVARWASDDVEGRLEMVLSTGVQRWRVVLERALGLLAAGAVIALANVVGVMVGAAISGVSLDVWRVVLASALTLPVALAFGAVGAVMAAIRPRVAMSVLIAVLAVSYLIPLMGVPLFHKEPPEWFLQLSVFSLYGSPLLEGVYWRGLTILLGAAAVGFAVALVAMQRREVGR